MNERKPALISTDMGKDEDSVQALQKKLDALELDIDNFQNTMGELSALSQGLTERGHFDSENIKQQQVSHCQCTTIKLINCMNSVRMIKKLTALGRWGIANQDFF